MAAYYNEIDPFAAAWLRELITNKLIAPGEVDERSIEDVRPDDLKSFTQCHFFAGIGVWSYALRRAGWDDSRRIWTMSCPCQPFSSAGAGAGFADERHLWPAAFQLIAQCRPPIVLGEQVASKFAEPWVDLVQTDLEAVDYAFGCIPFPSASVGAPHIRDRLFWAGHTDQPGPQGHAGHGGAARRQGPSGSATPAGVSGGMADSEVQRREDGQAIPGSQGSVVGETAIRERTSDNGEPFRLADSDGERRGEAGNGGLPGRETERAERDSRYHGPSPTNGFWRDADWLRCRDGKWRPVEPGTFPLAHGAPAQVVRLRAYGNAINAEAAIAFIESYMEA